MTKTCNELFEELRERGFTSATNALQIPSDNPRIFDCEYIWVDVPNRYIKNIGWNKRMGEPNINTFESKCSGLSPLRYIQILNKLKRGEF